MLFGETKNETELDSLSNPRAITHSQPVCLVVGSLPNGHVSAVCQSEAVLPQQLARVLDPVPLPTQG